MKVVSAALLASAVATDESASPIGKVIAMIGDLQGKVMHEGEVAQKEYDEYASLCEDQSRDLQNDIKTSTADVNELSATIEEETAHIAELGTKIEELAAGLSQDEKELKEATAVREKEVADFTAEEKELVETIDMIGKAIKVIEKATKGGAAMVQLKGATSIAESLSILVSASAIDSADATRLTALVQNKEQVDDDDFGAPAAAAYESKSGGIIDTLDDLREKADAQLAEARKKEVAAQQAYDMVAQGLNDSIKFATKDAAEAKKSLAACEEKKSVASGDLGVTKKDLAEDTATLAKLHHNCKSAADDFASSVKSRGEELAALAKAKAIIIEATGGAASFLQVDAPAHSKAVRFVRDLAKRDNSPALAQLASRMQSSFRLFSHSGDVFEKVKGLITDMISKLEAEAAKDADRKAFCDEAMAETLAKKEDGEAAVGKLTTALDQDTARATKLKEQVATLQAALAELATTQAAMDKLRAEQKATFESNEAETSKGLDGIKLALQTLRDYYAKGDKQSSGDAAGGIVAMLEVCETDFTKSLADMRTVEQTAAAEYEQETEANKMTKLAKSKDVEYKNKEATQLDKRISEATNDRATVQAELDAVLEYLEGLKNQCIAKAETYEEKKRRREAEIAGLKEALKILESEAFIQQPRALRGVRRH